MTLFGIILAYYLNSAPAGCENFMDSQSFGPRFILTAIALILKSPLLSLCARASASVSCTRLATKARHAYLDLRRPVPLTPLGSISYTVRRREWYAARLSVIAGVVIELFLVLIPGVPFGPNLTWTAVRTSWLGCIGCLGLTLLVTLVGWGRLVVKRASGVPGWPRLPTSVGAITMYVAGSNMAADCASSGGASISAKGALYEFSRQDGRWLVDYAEDAMIGEQGLGPRGRVLLPRGQGLAPHEGEVNPKRNSSSSKRMWQSYGAAPHRGDITSASLSSLHDWLANHQSE